MKLPSSSLCPTCGKPRTKHDSTCATKNKRIGNTPLTKTSKSGYNRKKADELTKWVHANGG
jgi:hypothetical protein